MSSAILVAGFLISAWLTHRCRDPASFLYIPDQPNERSLHAHPVARSGGIAILLALGGSVAGLALVNAFSRELVWLMPGVLALSAVSLLDDRFEVRPAPRLLVHGIAAGLVVYGGFALGTLELAGWAWAWPDWIAGLFSLLFMVWMINLYNFMDGMDGFAGGMAVIGFGTFALLGARAGNGEFVLLNLAVAAAAGGFLVFNFPPARIFMGDAGSSVLGFLAAAFSLWGAQAGIFPFWVAVVVFSPFIVDATVTLLRRLVRGEKVWQAHRSHYYQRLVQLGWGHRRTVLWEYALMLLSAVLAVVGGSAETDGQWMVLGIWLALYLGLMGWIDARTGAARKFA